MDYLEIRELYHHGIKGQRWGIRRFQNEDGSLTAEGKQRYQTNPYDGSMSKEGKKLYKQDKKQAKIANRSNAANAALGAAKGTGLAYAGLVASVPVLGTIGAHAVFSSKLKPDTKDKVLNVLSNPKVMTTALAAILATGAAAGAKVAYNKSKKAKEAEHVEHSGIKGQKWGIRRYQNEDGTLTDAGKARYNRDGSKKRLEQMSNEDLEKANRRLTAERNYNSLMGKNYKNRSSVTDIMLKAGVSATISALGSGGAYLIKKKVSDPNVAIGKDALKTAGLAAILGSSIGALSSVGNSLGGTVYIQNIVDKKKK